MPRARRSAFNSRQVQGWVFSLPRLVPTVSEAHPAFYSMGTGGSFRR